MQQHERVNVTPFGELVVSVDRGSLMGNRGILHDNQGNLSNRKWAHHNWVACSKSYKDIRRSLYSKDNYTELFFLDEATALAAGHRPCGLCRRDNFKLFREFWLKGNPEAGFEEDITMATIDRYIQADRVLPTGEKRTYPSRIANLPDGVMLTLPGDPEQAWLLWHGNLHLWTLKGYSEVRACQPNRDVTVLTPSSIVSAIIAGYKPTAAI